MNNPTRSMPAEALVRTSSRARSLLPWLAAAVFALGAAWVGQRYVALQAEVDALRVQNEMIDIALRSAEQQLEAERILGRWRLTDAKQQMERDGATPRAAESAPAGTVR
jgi:hypothetical protein